MGARRQKYRLKHVNERLAQKERCYESINMLDQVMAQLTGFFKEYPEWDPRNFGEMTDEEKERCGKLFEEYFEKHKNDVKKNLKIEFRVFLSIL